MLAEVDRWTLADTATQAELVARQKIELARITTRLDRILEVFIDGTISKDEFTAHKEKLTHEKSALAESIANFETKGANRFKPLADFITASRQAKYVAQTDDLEELRNWHKKAGSNLIFAGRILTAKGDERSEHAAEAASLLAASGASSEGPCGGSAARSACSSRPHKSAEIAPLSAVSADSSVSWSAFLPILSADLSAVASSGEVFRSLGSKTDPVLHVRFPAPWSIVAQNPKIKKWRRGRDSNPRYSFRSTHALQACPISHSGTSP